MSGNAAICTVQESGWYPSSESPAEPFRLQGAGLSAELVRLGTTTPRDMTPVSSEELVAVLEGHYRLVAGDECHDLPAGMAIIIPAGVYREWTALSDEGVLYRVWRR